MRKAIAILIAILIGCGTEGFAQGRVSRSKTQTTTTKQTKKQTQKTKPLTGEINGHEWVDLGLPSGTKWATCNVGADAPEEWGDYFAWGETTTKRWYGTTTSLTYNKSSSTLKSEGIINDKGELEKSHDAASINWGNPWRMPSENEFREIYDNCEWEWTEINGHKGHLINGSNGNSIFLPIADIRYLEGSFDSKRELCLYWSVSFSDDESNDRYAIGFDTNKPYYDKGIHLMGRDLGGTIRPVTK